MKLISEERLSRLLESEERLSRLHEGGVDSGHKEPC